MAEASSSQRPHREERPVVADPGSIGKIVWRVAGIVWACCLCLTLVGCVSAIESVAATSGASRTEGRVVAGRLPDGRWAVELPFPDPNARRSHKRGSGGGAVVRFEVDGQAYEIAARRRWFEAGYPLGDREQVVYHAREPEAGRIDSFSELWLFPTIGLVGLVVVVGGLVVGFVIVWRQMYGRGVAARPPTPEAERAQEA
jgi:hypothetical protein